MLATTETKSDIRLQQTEICVYLNFNGNCREAMQFYKDCFGGELTLQTVGQSPVAAQCAAAMQHQVMHSMLTGNGFVLMASDMLSGGTNRPGNNFSLTINCKSEEQLHFLFEKLSTGGQVVEPVKKEFWGALFGMLTDKFGIRWMLNYNQPQGA